MLQTRAGRVAAGGGGGGGGPTGPLDSFTTNLAAAWSSRRLLGSATAGLKLNNGTTSLDLGFDGSGNADGSGLTGHAAGGNDFIDWWYDQSGAGRHAKALASGNRLRIVSSGTTDVVNGHPVGIATDGSRGYLTDAFTAYTGATLSGYAVWKFGGASANYHRVVGACATGEADFNSNNNIAAILRSGTSTDCVGYRNGSVLTGGVSYSATGTTVAFSFRLDGANYTLIRGGGSSASVAQTTAFAFQRLLLFMQDETNFATETNSTFCEAAFWFGNQDPATPLANAKTYWGA